MLHTVLLVDDDPLVLDGLRRALHKETYEALSAVSADEALRILSLKKVDVVVSDEMIPGMPGSEFLGVVCNKYPETIRIMLTGRPDLDTALRSIHKGHVYRFLIKPCSGKELSIEVGLILSESTGGIRPFHPSNSSGGARLGELE